MSVADLRGIALFEGLGEEKLAALDAAGMVLEFAPGDELFHEARPADHWWLLLDGAVSLLRHVGHEETVLGAMDTRGQWAGGFRAWDEHGVYMATGRGAVAGRVLRVPADRLGELANAWFPFGVHLIRGLVHTVRNIESMARQREALVALGTLAAGLAHEINNPASAATRAVDALGEASEALLASLGRMAQGEITAEQFVALDALRRQADPATAGTDPMTLADREEALSDWLEEHDVDRPWEIAPSLAAAGLDVGWCDKTAALLGGSTLAAGLEWVASSLSTAALLSEVKESTHRISDLVAAVRSYSQLDRASTQPTDLVEGLESTLVMLAHRLGDVTVVRHYGVDVPRIEAVAGELNQVWTNLIGNAVDAMEGKGTLTVATRSDGNDVVVEIADTGPGMPPEVQTHAFEPFYTTKDVGKGTGLGLDISRRIITERHDGDISIHSGPAGTTLLVRLPLRRARGA
ncbi:MAG TPA: ATP-binding protein [Nocardioidaceae bacterium]|nr:ATP-binding protein [Nocardioidaceae bacterium]